jgi:hypothetical protein
LGVILAFGMTACGQDKALTFDELVPKVAEASKEMKSFTMEGTVGQDITITQGDQKQNQKMDMTVKMDATVKPQEIYQEVKTKTPDNGEQEIKQYITDKGIYTNMDGQWMKLPDEQKELIMASIGESTAPEKQLERLKSVAKDTKVTVEGDEYIIKAEMSGDGVKELAKSLMSQSGGGQQAAMLDNMDIKNIKVEYAVNKKSLYLTKANVEMTMNMEVEGQSVSLEMKTKSNFSNYNKIEKIEVPQEALDSAA